MTDEIVIIGKVGAPYGVKGWSKIISYTRPMENILDYQPWLIKKNSNWQELATITGKQHHKAIVAQLPGCADRDTAGTYTHSEIAIYRHQLPELSADEFYWSDLVGLTVKDSSNQFLGKVSQVLETGANDVLIVKAEKEFAIPFILNDVIKKVDLNAGEIIADWDPTLI